MKILLFYDNNKANKNITTKFIKKFVKNNIVYIPFRINLNKIFNVKNGSVLKFFDNEIIIKSINIKLLEKKCFYFDIKTGKQPEWKREDVLCIINFYDYDVSWTRNLRIPYIIYFKECNDEKPYSALNKAKSETNLLKFIIDFYDKLPKYIINQHQYNFKKYWRGNILNKLNDKNLLKKLKNSPTKGFCKIINYKLGRLKHRKNKMILSGWWENTMAPFFGNINRYGDFMKDRVGCAQFIVSRENILSLPKHFYIRMYNWLCKYSIGKMVIGNITKKLTRIKSNFDSNLLSHYNTSRYMEWSWEFIFTRNYLPLYYHKLYKPKNEKDLIVIYGNSRKLTNVTKKFKKLFLKKKKNIIKINARVNLKIIFRNLNVGLTNFLLIITKKKCKLVTDTDNYYNNIIIKI